MSSLHVDVLRQTRVSIAAGTEVYICFEIFNVLKRMYPELSNADIKKHLTHEELVDRIYERIKCCTTVGRYLYTYHPAIFHATPEIMINGRYQKDFRPQRLAIIDELIAEYSRKDTPWEVGA